MKDIFELNDELLDFVSAGAAIADLSEDEQHFYETVAIPVLASIKEGMYSLPAENRRTIKNNPDEIIETYRSMMGNVFPETVVNRFIEDLRTIISEMPLA